LNILFKLTRYFFIGLLSLSVFACSFIPPTPDNLNQNITFWLSQNEFDKIDKTLHRIDNKEAKYEKTLSQKANINKQKQNFINSTSKQAQQLKQNNNWQQALETYDNALQKIKNQPRLTKERADLIFERDEQIDVLKKSMMMQRANALISYKKVYDKLFKLIPEDDGAQQHIQRYNNNRIEVANQLNLCGEQARKNKQYLLANDCYALSNKLVPSKQKKSWISAINKQLINESHKKSSDELLAAYHAAYKKQQYQLAKKQLNTLLAINPSHEKTKTLLNSLNKKINEMTLEKIKLGKALYNSKKINAALETWQQALLLDPENTEIIQLINRAKKVSKKIQHLEENQ